MDDPLQKALDSLHQSITKRSRKSAAITSNDEEDKLFKTQSPDPSLWDQQDLIAFPFFSLEKRKRTKPIEYEQGGVKVEVDGPSKIGIATIWDAALLIYGLPHSLTRP